MPPTLGTAPPDAEEFEVRETYPLREATETGHRLKETGEVSREDPKW